MSNDNTAATLARQDRLVVRFRPDELKALRRAAELAGDRGTAGFVRRVALDAAQRRLTRARSDGRE